jgi:dephospho-CoA kinase
MPLVIGLTGGIGSGKSRAGALFEALGATVIDADLESHRLTAPGGGAMAAIEATFGPEFVTPQGALDRARMRSLVYADPTARTRLESILHPMIRAACDRQVQAASGPYVILMIPLLVEAGEPHARAHRVLVIDCDESTQIARVIGRDHLSAETAQRIIAAQASRSQRLAAADDVIDNEGTEDALAHQVETLHRRYASLARSAWPWPPRRPREAATD